MIGYFSDEELSELRLGACGTNVKISKTSTLYNCSRIFIGSNVRIDNFCILALSAGSALRIGNYVHVSAQSFVNGSSDVVFEDFVTLAPGVRIFSASDDYSGSCMTNAVVPEPFRQTISAPVTLRKHTIVGAGSTILPGVELAEGTAVGAHSLVKSNSEPFTIIAGVPATFRKHRSRELLEQERRFRAQLDEQSS